MTEPSENLTGYYALCYNRVGESRMAFGALFKKYLLRSEFERLSQFGTALTDHGYVFDDSTFSRWKNGSRIPSHRRLLLTILHIFRERGGVTIPEEANAFVASAGLGYLTDEETEDLFLTSLSAAPYQAPQLSAFFTGRHRTSRILTHFLKNRHIVLLHGPVGVGKTTLAIHTCYLLRPYFPDGVLWCRMDTSTIMDILATIAYSYGENVNHIRDAENRASIIRSILFPKKILLILDNAEPSHDLRLLLPNSPQASVLITSRHKILPHLSTYVPLQLNTFTEGESLLLYTKILGPAYIKQHRKQLMTLAALVGYLPLAINITAKHLIHASRNITNIVSQLKNEGGGLEALEYEDKNLTSSLMMTYQCLPSYTAGVFMSLSIFSGQDFSFSAVSSLQTNGAKKIARAFDRLVNASLIEHSVKGRYRVHPFIKLFIQSKCSPSRPAYERLAAYYTAFLTRANQNPTARYSLIEQELDNVLGIFFGCFKLKLYRPIINLWEYVGPFLWDTGRWSLMKRCAALVGNACRKESDTHALARCLLRELCWLHYWEGDIGKAYRYIRKGITLVKNLKDSSLLALAWIRLGKIYVSKRRPSKALCLFQRALSYFRLAHNREKEGDILTYIGETYWFKGQRQKAKYYLRRALRIVNAIHDTPQKITIVSRLGCIALQEHRVNQAIRYFQKSLRLERESGRRVGDTFWNNLALGLAYEAQRRYEVAKEKFLLAKEEMRRIGFTEKIFQTDVFPMIFRKELGRSTCYASAAPPS